MKIEKYKSTNYWAIYENNGDMVGLEVYKKGALEVVRKLDEARGDKEYQPPLYDISKLIKNLSSIKSELDVIIKELRQKQQN